MNLPEYSKVSTAFRQAQALSEPAESHGTLCGLLAAAPEADWQEQWLRLSLNSEGQGAVSLPASVRPVLDALYDATQAEMVDLQMRFEPLLPDDDHGIAERARCLGLWCQGFLFGFSTARPGSHEGLPPQVREVLDDLGRLAQVEPPQGEGSDEDEAALLEIVEYIRVAAQLVHDELKLKQGQPPTDTRH
ncbi:UPF0149 family protein [Gammaproteobacteria bacterium AB-CW1]|uniref:UPF0149 family protein n=1 Tax=Natronospira elongata TaxID=3110268 RepID=A0AAP6JGH6_9GAMM|nr:UPF0149 family protein [Gammaproteobacteria bacterium AB-CW1]